MDSDIRCALSPNPEPFEGFLYRVHFTFEEHDGRLWSTDTDLMIHDLETARGLADRRNSPLGWKSYAWMAFADRFLDWDPVPMSYLAADPADSVH